MSLLPIYERLSVQYGAQNWWPAETAFEMMVGAVLTQNTAWINAERAITNLRQCQCLSAEGILALSDPQLGGLLRPAGYFNLKSKRVKNLCRWYVAGGGYAALNQIETQVLRQSLLAINGIGPETADDILLYAFSRPTFVIDAYTRRIFTRLGLIDEDLPYEPLRAYFELNLVSEVTEKTVQRQETVLTRLYNEYHALIVIHAKETCRPRALCTQCCLAIQCDYYQHNH